MTERSPNLTLEERAALAAEEVGRIATLISRSPEHRLDDSFMVDDQEAGMALHVGPNEITVELREPARIIFFKQTDLRLHEGRLTSKTVADVSYGSKGHIHQGNTFHFEDGHLDPSRNPKSTSRRERQILASIITAREVIGELTGIERPAVNS